MGRLGIAAWFILVTAGMVSLWRYESTPAILEAAIESWPRAARFDRASDRSTLVMIAHPKCPCTRASVAELAEIMRRAGDKVRAHVLFVRPPGADARFVKSALWDSASAIPNVEVHEDVDGVEASRFGATTSGHTLIFDDAGRRRFSGGITASRGHAGDNFGRQRVLALLSGAPPDKDSSPTFGCDLRDPSAARE